MSNIKFARNPLFFSALREKTEAYFTSNNLKKTGDLRLFSKTVILLTTLSMLYIWLVFFTPASVLLSLFLCSIMGINISAIGFNVMHDGAHGSYSSKPWVNNTMALALNLLGGNALLWQQKHNINHHSFTNVEGLDDDIDIKPFIRIHEDQKGYWFHKFQHVYALFLYGLTYFFWVFYRDFKKYFTGKIAENTPMKKMTLNEHIIFWLFKVIHFGIFLVLPIYYAGLWQTIVGYLTMSFVTGLMLAIVFQLAHVVEDAHFYAPETGKEYPEVEWAIHQVNTTVNFGTRSKMLNWLLGGLNFQVEHHLFPKISHVHYPAINKIVMETCKEYNVSYKEYPTMLSAFRSHMHHLKTVGQAA